MSTTVLPSLPGLVFPWKRTPTFKTRTQTSVSGKEVRIADWSTPRYQWELSYSALRQGTINGSFTEFATFEGFFETLLGGFDSFLYVDPDDNAVITQAIGTGDGATKNFQMRRTFGGASMSILAPNLGVSFSVFDNGTLKTNGTDYSITPWGTSDPVGPGVIKFVTAPVSTHAITATFQYYFPCRFDDDTLTFEKMMAAVYQLEKVSFTSIK